MGTDEELPENPLEDVEEHERLSIPVMRSDDGRVVVVSPNQEAEIIVGGLTDDDVPAAVEPGEPWMVSGPLSRYMRGRGDAPSHVFLEAVDDWRPIACPEATDRTVDDAGSGNTEDSSQGGDSSPREDDDGGFPASPGKEIRTDRGDERKTGRNPFADPERIKDLGLHQGGG